MSTQMKAGAGSGVPLLLVEHMSKSFGSRRVLNDVSMQVAPGEIHGLVGHNGSGKSTLIKILSGFHLPDAGGRVELTGTQVEFPMHSSSLAHSSLAFVHQDLGLFPDGSVLENLRVGRYLTGPLWKVSWRRERALVSDAFRRFGVDQFDPETKVRHLTELEQTIVAIVRGLEQMKEVEKGILILDEPTSYLPKDGVDMLFKAVRAMANRGLGVVFVSHRLEEIKQLTDHVTVLREGSVVHSGLTSELGEGDLVQHMLGFPLSNLYPDAGAPARTASLQVRGLVSSGIENLDLDVHNGEILGLTGLIGMGHERILYLLFGAERALAGVANVAGETLQLASLTPKRAMRAGLALIPGNRSREGSWPDGSSLENVTLASLRNHMKGWFLSKQSQRTAAIRMLDNFAVSPNDPGVRFGSLSGGNQQKAILAKWFETEPRIVLLDEPTQGVDIGARKQIFDRLRSLANQGKAIVVASSEADQLAGLCDRVLVFRGGKIVSELRGASLSEKTILDHSYRAHMFIGAKGA